jgi:Uma2 family endonuclease
MGMPNTAERWTAERVRALPDDWLRHEVVDGELLMTPAPSWRHQDAVMALHQRLAPWLSTHGAGRVVVAPADIVLDPHTLVQPDLFVVPLVNGRRPSSWEDVGSLLLVVEVLSPSTARYDRELKRRRYQRAGVPEYWIVDPDGRVVERWRANDTRPEILAEQLQWEPSSGTTFTLDLPAYFREVWGE